MRYSTYLFDLDGTLIDSVALIVASHRHTRREHFGDDPFPDSHYIATMGRTLADVYGELAAPGRDAGAMIATYRAWNEAHHDRMVRAYDGVAEALQRLAEGGAQLAVVTSKARRLAQRGLAVAALERWFPLLVGGDDVVRGKPDPEPVLHALARLGAKPEHTLMVGDSPHDMLAGRRAGVRTAAVLWGPFARDELALTAPDHCLETPADLLALG